MNMKSNTLDEMVTIWNKKGHLRTIQNLRLKNKLRLYKYNIFINQGCVVEPTVEILAYYITLFTKSLDSVTHCHRQGLEFMVHS